MCLPRPVVITLSFLGTFLGQYNQEMHKPFWSTDSGNNKNHLIFLEYFKTIIIIIMKLEWIIKMELTMQLLNL